MNTRLKQILPTIVLPVLSGILFAFSVGSIVGCQDSPKAPPPPPIVQQLEFCDEVLPYNSTALDCVSSIADISKITLLTHLEDLFLISFSLENIEPLEELVHLKRLIIGAPLVVDMTPLGSLENLELLRISGTGITDLTPLVGIKKLKKLSIDARNIEDLRPIAQLSSLTVLELGDIASTPKEQIRALKKALPELEVWYTTRRKDDINEVLPQKFEEI